MPRYKHIKHSSASISLLAIFLVIFFVAPTNIHAESTKDRNIKTMDKALSDLAKTLPKRMDSSTTLISVMRQSDVVIYTSRTDYSEEELGDILEKERYQRYQSTKNTYCTGMKAFQMVGWGYRTNLLGRNGKLLSSILIKPQDCRSE